MAAPVFKIPSVFLAEHKAVLEAWDWTRQPEMGLSTVFPEAGFRDTDVLEAVGRGSTTVVRSRWPATMLRLRAIAAKLERDIPSISALNGRGDDVAAVLKRRNPERPE